MQDSTKPKSELLRRLPLLDLEGGVCDHDLRDGVVGGDGGNLKLSIMCIVQMLVKEKHDRR